MTNILGRTLVGVAVPGLLAGCASAPHQWPVAIGGGPPVGVRIVMTECGQFRVIARQISALAVMSRGEVLRRAPEWASVLKVVTRVPVHLTDASRRNRVKRVSSAIDTVSAGLATIVQDMRLRDKRSLETHWTAMLGDIAKARVACFGPH